MALEEEVPETPDDKTIPKYRQIDKRCAGYLMEFGEVFDKTYKSFTRHKETKLSTGRKRGTHPGAEDEDDEEDEKPKPKKRVKKEPESQTSGGITDQEMADINDKGQISKQSVASLKDFLKARGESATGKKLDLVERTQSYLAGKGL